MIEKHGENKKDRSRLIHINYRSIVNHFHLLLDQQILTPLNGGIARLCNHFMGGGGVNEKV